MKLDDVFAAWDESKQFGPSYISYLRGRDINGGLYNLPITMNCSMFWYRIDRFKDAGLQPPKTWDDFYNAIAKLTDTSKGQYGFVMRAGDSGGPDQLQQMLFAYTGAKSYFDANGKAAFRDPVALDFLTKYASVFNKYTAAGDVNNNYQMMVAAFDSGSANVLQHNLGSLGEHKKNLPAGTFGTFLYPNSVKGYLNLRTPDTTGYSIYAGAKQKDAAWNFLKFLCGAKSMSFWNQKIGQYPVRLDVQKEDWVQNADHLKNLVTALQAPDTSFYEFPSYLPEYQQIINQIAIPGWQAVLLGKKTPAAFLDEWSTAIEQAYQRYQAATKK